jgi:hypothetical protein
MSPAWAPGGRWRPPRTHPGGHSLHTHPLPHSRCQLRSSTHSNLKKDPCSHFTDVETEAEQLSRCPAPLVGGTHSFGSNPFPLHASLLSWRQNRSLRWLPAAPRPPGWGQSLGEAAGRSWRGLNLGRSGSGEQNLRRARKGRSLRLPTSCPAPWDFPRVPALRCPPRPPQNFPLEPGGSGSRGLPVGRGRAAGRWGLSGGCAKLSQTRGRACGKSQGEERSPGLPACPDVTSPSPSSPVPRVTCTAGRTSSDARRVEPAAALRAQGARPLPVPPSPLPVRPGGGAGRRARIGTGGIPVGGRGVALWTGGIPGGPEERAAGRAGAGRALGTCSYLASPGRAACVTRPTWAGLRPRDRPAGSRLLIPAGVAAAAGSATPSGTDYSALPSALPSVYRGH